MSLPSLLNFEHLAQKYQNCTPQLTQIHTLLITTGFLCSGHRRPPTSIYNVLIKSYCRRRQLSPSVHLFTHMLSTLTPPSSHTFPPLIKTSSSLALHAQVLRRGFHLDAFVVCCFVRLYSDLGRVGDARKVFDEMGRPDPASSNAMLDGLFRNGEVGSAVGLFEGGSAEKDVVSWTTMVGGFVRNRRFRDALRWLRRMVVEKEEDHDEVRPNEGTIVCGLSACAEEGTGSLIGKEIHGYVIRCEHKLTAFIGTALVDFYGKSGNVDYAMRVFKMTGEKKVGNWNAVISALACNGKETQALAMFKRMISTFTSAFTFEFPPNGITFVAVLTACARGSHVEAGLRWFRSMDPEFGVAPGMEHYGCMVHLFGRAGLLEEAFEFVRRMPFEPDGSVLGALLGACKVHGNVGLAGDVGRRLLEMQPMHSGRYMVLSNVYAGAGMWDVSSKVKEVMDNREFRRLQLIVRLIPLIIRRIVNVNECLS